MHVRIANRGGGENNPGTPSACAICNFTYLIRGPCGVWWFLCKWRVCIITAISRNAFNVVSEPPDHKSMGFSKFVCSQLKSCEKFRLIMIRDRNNGCPMRLLAIPLACITITTLHNMETFSASLILCEGNSPATVYSIGSFFTILPGMGLPILSVPLFSQFFIIWKTQVTSWIARLYLTDVTAV